MAGTVTTSDTKVGRNISVIEYDWTADADDSTVPATAGPAMDGYVLFVVTDPGGTAPTADYDITLTDSDGCDVMGGELGDRSATVSQQAFPKAGNAYGKRYVNGTLTLNISNNSVKSATGIVKVYMETIP